MGEEIQTEEHQRQIDHRRRHLLYVPPDLDAAYEEWGCNCGPASLAALAYKTCAEIRPLFPGFEQRRYANPTHLLAAMRELFAGCGYAKKDERPNTGLLFIQWGGPWCAPGVPVGAAYRHTHWIAVMGEAVFDCNAGHWVTRETWERPEDGVAAWIISHNPKADGTWFVRSALEVWLP